MFIYGPAGSGKTTLALRLGRELEVPVHHLDAVFHRTADDHVPHEEAMQIVRSALKGPDWIIEGNNGTALADCAREADHVVILNVSRTTSLYRLIKRRLGPHTDLVRATSRGGANALPFHLIRFVLFQHPRMRSDHIGTIERNASGHVWRLAQDEARAFIIRNVAP